MFADKARSLPKSGVPERCFWNEWKSSKPTMKESHAGVYLTRVQYYESFYGPNLRIFIQTRVFVRISLSGTNTTLLRKFVNYGQKKLYNIGPNYLYVYTKISKRVNSVTSNLTWLCYHTCVNYINNALNYLAKSVCFF
jgi:hypothetical protein